MRTRYARHNVTAKLLVFVTARIDGPRRRASHARIRSIYCSGGCRGFRIFDFDPGFRGTRAVRRVLLHNHHTLPSSRACVRGRAGVARHSARHPVCCLCQMTRRICVGKKQSSAKRKGHAILHSVSVKTAGPNPKVDVTFHACRDNDL
jgi:hypothetical protein